MLRESKKEVMYENNISDNKLSLPQQINYEGKEIKGSRLERRN
jgi:hypothetical protein